MCHSIKLHQAQNWYIFRLISWWKWRGVGLKSHSTTQQALPTTISVTRDWRAECLLILTLACLPSMTATQELVVPRSMPITAPFTASDLQSIQTLLKMGQDWTRRFLDKRRNVSINAEGHFCIKLVTYLMSITKETEIEESCKSNWKLCEDLGYVAYLRIVPLGQSSESILLKSTPACLQMHHKTIT